MTCIYTIAEAVRLHLCLDDALEPRSEVEHVHDK
jgi:hypothetical protein